MSPILLGLAVTCWSARQAPWPERRSHRPNVPALRRESLDCQALPPSLQASAVRPGGKPYASLRPALWRTGSPGLVIRRAAPEVIDASSTSTS
jgi:hypothetical protein